MLTGTGGRKSGTSADFGLPVLMRAARMNGMSYSMFISGLKKAGVQINRKVLADLAVNDGAAFEKLVSVAKQQQ